MGAASLSNFLLLAVGPLLGAAQHDMVPGLLEGRPFSQSPLWLDPNRQLGVASCIVDVGVSTVQLAQAGLNINRAVTKCGTQYNEDGSIRFDPKTGKEQRQCAATVVGITASFQYAAFFMTSAALDCGKTFTMIDKQAMNNLQCAADTQQLLASLTLIASAGTSVSDACKDTTFYNPPQQQTGEERSQAIAECVFDVGQAVLLLSRAGLFITAAVKDCSAMSLFQGPDKNKAKCSVDIGNVIGAFAFAARGIAEMAHCPEFKKHAKPQCASAILNLIAGTAKVQASATSMSIDCTPAAVSAERPLLASNASASVKNVEFI